MARLARWLLRAACILSLLLCFGLIIIWVRSQHLLDASGWRGGHLDKRTWHDEIYTLMAYRGRAGFYRVSSRYHFVDDEDAKCRSRSTGLFCISRNIEEAIEQDWDFWRACEHRIPHEWYLSDRRWEISPGSFSQPGFTEHQWMIGTMPIWCLVLITAVLPVGWSLFAICRRISARGSPA